MREIASRKRTPKLPEDFDVVADLSPPSISTGVDQSSTPRKATKQEHVEKRQAVGEANVAEVPKPSARFELNGEEISSSPAQIVEHILSDAFGSEKATEMLEQIRLLQSRAIVCIKEYPNAAIAESKDTLWIPPVSARDCSSCDSGNKVSQRGGNRGLLHQNIKLAFPLLKSETAVHVSTQQLQNANASEATKEEHRWIRVSIDDTFLV